MIRGHRKPDQRGAVAVELALLVPAAVLLAAVCVGGGRVWHARVSVEQVAASAARAASLQRAAPLARAAAIEVAAAQAVDGGLRCSGLDVHTWTAGFAVPAGTKALVEVEVTCRVPLSDVTVPGWPGEITLRASAASVLDSYRERR